MDKNKALKNSLLFLGCVGIVLIFRIIPHPPNFTPVIALSLYLPIIFGLWSLPFCILGFAITDYFVGFHSLLIWTWGSLLLVGLISKFSKKIINRLILVLLGSSVFFVFSNFGDDPNVVERIPTGIDGDPGEVVFIYDSFQNLGNVETAGLDIDMGYALDTSEGLVNLRFVMNYVLKYEEFRPAADGGQRLFKSEGEFEQPEFRWTASADWRGENYTAALAVNYISEFDDDAEAGFGDQTVDAMTTVDVTVSYIGFDKLTLTVGATNLFNEEPPFSYADFMGFAPTVHSGQGRFSYVQASYQF